MKIRCKLYQQLLPFIYNEVTFPDMSTHQPVRAHMYLDLLPDNNDWLRLSKLYSRLIVKVITSHIPSLSFMDILCKESINVHADKLTNRTKVIPLPVTYDNEMNTSDVINIMSGYETLIKNIYNNANVEVEDIHIGGDQLTRERKNVIS